MVKKIALFLITCIVFGTSTQANETLLKVTPIQPISTHKKENYEGVELKFRVTKSVSDFTEGEIITGYEIGRASCRERV